MKKQNIQVLRILACFGVFAVHMGQQLEFEGCLRNITDCGAMGVYLFFLISGYVSCVSFNRNNDGKVKLSHYYVSRFARMVPVYYAIILGQFVLHTYILNDVPIDQTHLGWSRYIFFISSLVPADNIFWTNLNATWTIGAFILFYLIAPLLNKYIRNYNTAVIGWGAAYVISFVLNKYTSNSLNPIIFLPYFIFGIIIYYIEAEKKEIQLIFFYIINLLLIIVGLSDWNMSVWVMLFGLLVLGSKGLVINNKIINYCVNIIDEYSYSIYLIHATVIEYIARWKLNHIFHWRIQALFILLIGTIVGVLFVHNLIEKPFYSIIMKLEKQWNGRQ